MRVLDLDMDFFLSGPCPLAPLGQRPSDDCQTPWTDEAVIGFLERQCGLDKTRPVPGAIFDTHDKALDFWQARLSEGTLKAPFEVVHVDTHSDLAFGPPGTAFVLKGVISRPPLRRPSVADYRRGRKLDEANYLLFALGFRWIDRLSYIRNPKSYQDIPKELLNENGDIFLRSDVSALMEAMNGPEPAVPFSVYDDYRTYSGGGFDFVTMAQSPRYAPKSADRIMALLSPYLVPTPWEELK